MKQLIMKMARILFEYFRDPKTGKLQVCSSDQLAFAIPVLISVTMAILLSFKVQSLGFSVYLMTLGVLTGLVLRRINRSEK